MKKIFIFVFVLFTAYYLLLTVTSAQESNPTLKIVFPTEGYVFGENEKINLSFDTENFLFVNFKNNLEPFPGNNNAGHAHYWIDPPKGDLNHNSAEVVLQDFRPINLGTLLGGEHRIVVELTQNHDVRYEPPVTAEVMFKVGKAGVSGVAIDFLIRLNPLYGHVVGLLTGILLGLLSFMMYRKVKYKRKVRSVKEELNVSDSGGQKT